MKTALISVSKKSKEILEFAKFLISNNYRIISTEGTYQYFLRHNLDTIEISKITKFPEILNGRVKTLHPIIHGGILAKRNNSDHMETINKYYINTIDIVFVDLYPFFENISKNYLLEQMIEFIDIGGVSMLRSAGKSFFDVTVICNISDCELVQNEILKKGKTSFTTRKKLAGKVFNFISAYDAAISKFLLEDNFPNYFVTSYKKIKNLRYGENPHQKASYYINTMQDGAMKNFNQLGGKDLSFNNIRDMDLAWKIVCEFNKFSCCAIKHSIPCGVALGNDPLITYKKTIECDPISIFGGIIAMNYCVDLITAKELNKTFLEIVLATDFNNDALKELQKKKNLRIIKINQIPKNKIQYVQVDGGLLVQEIDNQFATNFQFVTNSKPTNIQLENLIFAQKVCKYVKSNAIVIVSNKQAIGISGGKVNRILAARDALKAATKKINNNIVLASDAFFPFRDVVDIAKKFGVKSIIQPGGSIRDKESIQACNEYNISMVFTKMRHFLH